MRSSASSAMLRSTKGLRVGQAGAGREGQGGAGRREGGRRREGWMDDAIPNNWQPCMVRWVASGR